MIGPRARKKPAPVVTVWREPCNHCGHPKTDHGDRALGGICAGGLYPSTACPCEETP